MTAMANERASDAQCPACRSTQPHRLDLRPTMPRLLMSDGEAVGLQVAICQNTGAFIWWTTGGWYMSQEADGEVQA